MIKKGNLEKKIQVRHIFLSSSVFFLGKKINNNLLEQYFFAIGPWILILKCLFCLFHGKTRWTTSMDDVGLNIRLLGTSNPMATLTFFFGCKPKWSWDEFNNQSHILQGLAMTSWSMLKQPLTTPHLVFCPPKVFPHR